MITSPRLVLLALSLGCAVALPLPRDGETPKRAPNIIFVLTDDQDVVMDGSAHQPKIHQLLGKEGVTILNQFASTPVCCPSRSSFVTGRHIHNIPMTNNSIAGNCSGPNWNAGPEKRSIGVHLQSLGYRTLFAGKYLNQYGAPPSGGLAHVPPGWTKWIGLKGNSIYYNYSLSVDGVEEKHGDDYATDYLTDLLANRSVEWVGESRDDKRPFFAFIAPPSAHGPHEPAPQYANAFTDKPFAKAVRTPNYGPEYSSNKSKTLQMEARFWREQPTAQNFSDWEHVRRLETLLSVDDMVEALVNKVTEMGELDNTYFFYASDHGYHLGQLGLMKDKRYLYEFDLRTPGYARGPGLAKGAVSDAVVVNVDMAPTFIDIAGGEVPADMDGRSVLSDLARAAPVDADSLATLLTSPATSERLASPIGESSPTKRNFLVEYHGEGSFQGGPGGPCASQWQPGLACWIEANEKLAPFYSGPLVCSCQDSVNNTYSCLRSLANDQNSIYCEFQDGWVEYYDLAKDPWQKFNAAPSLSPDEAARLHAELSRLRACRGADCHVGA